MPVKTADLNRRVICRGEAAFPGHKQQPGENTESDDHVQRVQAGHHEVKGEKYFRVLRVGVLAGTARNRYVIETERSAGHMMLFKLIFVLFRLDSEECQAEEHGQGEHADQKSLARGLR